MTSKKRPNAPSYTAGCYAIPIRFLYGSAAEINFWDVVYFSFHEAGGAFETSIKDLARQMGISRQVVGRLRRQALRRGELLEDVAWSSGRRFVLRPPNWPLRKGIIYKPLGYVRNNWHQAVAPAIPKRVLNLYLQQPRQRVYRLETRYVADRCKRRFPGDKHRTVAPLNSADVGRALRLLIRLGLLAPAGDGLRIDWKSFNRPAPPDGPSFDAPDPRQHPLYRQAAVVDARRAERAVELLDVGHYDLDTHLAEILRDLAYARDDDYALLKAKVYRRRNRPPSPNRWRDTWKAFQYELRRRVVEVRAPKSILRLDEATFFDCPLALDLSMGRVLSVRMVSRVEWPWYVSAPVDQARPEQSRRTHGVPFDEAHGVHLKLRSGDKDLFTRTIDPSDAEVRYTLHPNEWPDPSTPLTLAARCGKPLPGVSVEAWLEARLRR
jgi:hypothetical protein